MAEYFNGTGQSLMANTAYDSNQLGGGLNSFSAPSSGFMQSARNGFGLNPISGVLGIAGGFLAHQATEDQLKANESQINLAQKQNKMAYIQKISGNNMKLATILSGARVAAAGHGVSMDSGNIGQALIRNLSAYDQDNLSDYANYSFSKQQLEEKRIAAEQAASDSDESSIFGSITSFFK